MSKSSSNNVSVVVKNSKSTVSNKQPFWKFLCPCLCSNKSNSKKLKESQGRQQFYEEKTQNEENVHEETQSNLPVKLHVSQFEVKKSQEVRLEKQQQETHQMKRRNEDSKTIKFNVKRINNMGNYLNDIKTVQNRQDEGKQNSKPNLTLKQRYSAEKSKNRNSDDLQIYQGQVQSKSLKGKRVFQKLNNNRIGVNREQLISIEKHLQQMEGLADYQFLQNWQKSYENHYPINKLSQNKLILLGDKSNKMLAKVSSVKLSPSASSIQRYKESIKNKKISQKYGNKDVNSNTTLDRYWDKRYFLFQRFDQGIKLDDESWYSVTPQAVADYMSSKVNVKETILDAFCGAGGDSIKLAMSCKHVISNDIDPVKLNCLSNNAQIYDVNNIQISNSDFFKLNCKVAAVYLAPPWGGPDYYKIQSFNPDQFEPKLSLIIEKALTLSSNIFFLLPANTDVEALTSILCEKIRKIKHFVPESCALKLQKIYFNERLKFVAGFYGNSEVQNDIKLTDELGFIYDLFRQNDDGVFKHKRLIRKVREQYGMVNLLNFAFQCEIYGKSQQNANSWSHQQSPLIEKFEKLLLHKKLIDEKTLQKINQQQQIEYEYELKNRQNKSKKQKNKRIQKHREKQQRHLSQNQEGQSRQQNIDCGKEQCPEEEIQSQNSDIQILQIIKEANRPKHKLSHQRNEMTETINSKISSDVGIEESQQVQRRDSMRTVSMASEFHEDQLHNITYERLTTQSEISIKDSIYPIQNYDHLQISIDENARISRQSRQILNFLDQKKRHEQLHEAQSYRFTSLAILSSPRENIKMKKVIAGPKWEKGIVQEVNEDREKDI